MKSVLNNRVSTVCALLRKRKKSRRKRFRENCHGASVYRGDVLLLVTCVAKVERKKKQVEKRDERKKTRLCFMFNWSCDALTF